MPRSTDNRKKRSYNLLMYEDDYDKIYSLSVQETRRTGVHVTKAAIIREAISRFLREIAKQECGKTERSAIVEGLQ